MFISLEAGEFENSVSAGQGKIKAVTTVQYSPPPPPLNKYPNEMYLKSMFVSVKWGECYFHRQW